MRVSISRASRPCVGTTGSVLYLLIDGRRCDDEDISRLSLARARRSRSYSSSEMSELESSDDESESDDDTSAPGNAPGMLYARADGCRFDGVRLSPDGNWFGAAVAVALTGVIVRAE